MHDQHETQEAPAPDGEGAGPPLVLERFRSMGRVVGLLLAPLLVVTLASVNLTSGIAAAVVLGTAIVLIALRDRWAARDRDDEDDLPTW